MSSVIIDFCENADTVLRRDARDYFNCVLRSVQRRIQEMDKDQCFIAQVNKGRLSVVLDLRKIAAEPPQVATLPVLEMRAVEIDGIMCLQRRVEQREWGLLDPVGHLREGRV